jgi:hypothetical protein
LAAFFAGALVAAFFGAAFFVAAFFGAAFFVAFFVVAIVCDSPVVTLCTETEKVTPKKLKNVLACDRRVRAWGSDTTRVCEENSADH